MQRLFAVTRTRGEAWHPGEPLEAQPSWHTHARFMDELVAGGIVVLGGPLEGSPDVLLIMRAETPEQIVEQLAADPWTEMQLLRTTRISPWTLRLGSL